MAGSGKKARGKHRLDKYYFLAKEQGYRSRAAFKLIQLNKKHGFLDDARAVLDLCAAPGGWLQVCSKHMPTSSRIIGVDLDPIKSIKGVTTLVDDITTQECRDRLRKESKGSLFDVVLHDGAPNVGGAFASEQYTQSALTLDACKLACEFLRPEGSFVTKVFRSRDYTALLYAFKQLFKRVDATKPQASRGTSAEIFVVCSGYRAPAKLDPRLLDHRILFQDLAHEPEIMGPDALLKTVKKKIRHRTGYDDDVTGLMDRPVSAVAFVLAQDPVPMLARFKSIKVLGPESHRLLPAADGESEEPQEMPLEVGEMADIIREDSGTTAEIRLLCADLQVLGRNEFKALLKWRLKVKKAIDVRVKEAAAAEGGDSDDEMDTEEAAPGKELTREEALLAEMEELRTRMERRQHKDRKKRRLVKKKAKMRLAQMAATSGIGEEVEQGGEDKLFSLQVLKQKRALGGAIEASALDEADLDATLYATDSDDEMVDSEGEGSEGSDVDSDDERLQYEAMVEEYVDAAYQGYLERKDARAAQKVEQRKRKRLAEEDGTDGSGAIAQEDLDALPEVRTDSESEDDYGLLVDLEGDEDAVKPADNVANNWFAQDAFKADDLLDDDVAATGKAAPAAKAASTAEPKSKKARAAKASESAEEAPSPAKAAKGAVKISSGAKARRAKREATADASADSDSDAEEAAAISGMKAADSKKAALRAKRDTDKAGLEVVKQKPVRNGGDSDSTDTEDEFEAMTDDAKSEIRAMARKWMKSRKNQLSLLDAAYNRYTFNDADLPRWFKDDESKHMRPMTPVTREEMEVEKELLRAIDMRSTKKVAEAKMRKRRKVQVKMDQARSKAETIVDNEDMSIHTKAKEIGKLYAKAKAHGKDKKAGVNPDRKLSRSEKEKAAKKGPPLDRRMVADKMSGKARAITKAKRKGQNKGGKR